MNEAVVKQIQGKAFYAKILGNPGPNYNKDGFEWSLDVSLDKETVKELKALGLGSKIKDANEKHGDLPYITFRRGSVKKAGPKAGEANPPIRTVGEDGKTLWDPNRLIGNGTQVAVKFAVHEVIGGPKKQKFTRADILAIQIRELVPYEKPEQQDFDAVNGSGTPAAANW
jgi:hypothetical protein